MALLQPKLSLKVAQRQVLTPGLMQMVSVLALNKLELKEMIDAEMVENPVLEEIDESVPMLDQVAGREERLERGVEERVERGAEESAAPPKDPFNEIDFGSYFQEYLDPGYRTQPEYEDSEKPSFENFLSQPTTLSDHLAWQLGALSLESALHLAAEFVIGNLNEDGYLAGSEEELAQSFDSSPVRESKRVRRPCGSGAEAETGRELHCCAEASTWCSTLTRPVWGPGTCGNACSSRLRRSSTSSTCSMSTAGTEAAEVLQSGRFEAEAELRIAERRRSMEVAALIVDQHPRCCKSGT